jgi:hypothetical protein
MEFYQLHYTRLKHGLPLRGEKETYITVISEYYGLRRRMLRYVLENYMKNYFVIRTLQLTRQFVIICKQYTFNSVVILSEFQLHHYATVHMNTWIIYSFNFDILNT